MGSRRAEDGPHAWPLAVEAWWRLWWAFWLSTCVFIAVGFTAVIWVAGDSPRWGVDHSDPSAVDLCMAHVAVGGLCSRVEDITPQNGVGSGGLTRLWTPQDQQPTLRRVSTSGVPC